jgi:hypothetical protein
MEAFQLLQRPQKACQVPALKYRLTKLLAINAQVDNR